MVFVIIVFIFIISSALFLYFLDKDFDFSATVSGIIMVASFATLFMMAIAICVSHLGVEGEKAELKQEYNSLVYQLENNLYDNDNDLGKKELYDDITEWNINLAGNKEYQRDIWIGIFYPDIYDEFNFIELE